MDKMADMRYVRNNLPSDFVPFFLSDSGSDKLCVCVPLTKQLHGIIRIFFILFCFEATLFCSYSESVVKNGCWHWQLSCSLRTSSVLFVSVTENQAFVIVGKDTRLRIRLMLLICQNQVVWLTCFNCSIQPALASIQCISPEALFTVCLPHQYRYLSFCNVDETDFSAVPEVNVKTYNYF